MKRIPLALAAALLSTQTFAQTQFPANTLWGNFTASTGLPTTVLVPNCPTGSLNFTAGTGFGCVSGGGTGGGITGPGTSVVDHLVTWANTSGTALKDSTWTPTLGVNTGGNTNPGIFSVGWSQTPVTANRVLWTVDDTANSANGHWISSQLGTGASPYVMQPGATIVYSLSANVGNNTGSFPMFYQQWFSAAASAGIGGSIIGLFIQSVTNGTWTPGATGNPGPLGLLTLAEADTGGFAFAINSYARCKTISCTQVVGVEVDLDNEINGTINKIGIQVVDVSTSTGTIVSDSSAYLALSQALGFKTGLQFGTSTGTLFPITSTGTIIKAYGNTAGSTVANGIDFGDSHLTISGCTLKGPAGLCITGSGHITGGGVPVVSACGSGVLQAGSTDVAGVITTAGATCVINWANTYTHTPSCVANNTTHAANVSMNPNISAAFISGMTAGDGITYVCFGN